MLEPLPTPSQQCSLAMRRAANRAMARCASGADDAFDEVYAYLAPRLESMLLRRTRDPHFTQDLLQQATFRIYRHRHTYRPDGDVLHWALTIVRHILIDEIRRQRRSPIELAFCEESGAEYAPSGDGEYAARELAERFQTVLAALPGTQRAAFELLRLEGLSHREAARRLGITVPAVKLRAHRAYDALRAALVEAGAGVG